MLDTTYGGNGAANNSLLGYTAGKNGHGAAATDPVTQNARNGKKTRNYIGGAKVPPGKDVKKNGGLTARVGSS